VADNTLPVIRGRKMSMSLLSQQIKTKFRISEKSQQNLLKLENDVLYLQKMLGTLSFSLVTLLKKWSTSSRATLSQLKS
jgi:hypothetical protein